MFGNAGGGVRRWPDLPWKVRLFVTAISFFTDASFRRNGTVNRWLINLIDFKASPSDNPVNGVATSDISVDAGRNLWFRYFLPSVAGDGQRLPVIVFFHGGGFVMLSPSSRLFDDLCRRLAREIPAVIVSVNYRLAPEHRYPASYKDGLDVLTFIDENPPANADLTRCFIVGDSAGGNIAHHVTARAGEFRTLKIVGVILMQPYFGGEERTQSEIQLEGAPLVSVERTDWCWRAFLPEGSDRDHPAANVFGPNSTDADALGLRLPRSLVFMGGFDPLRDWQRRYCEGLRRNGIEVEEVDYPNAMHFFYGFPELPESNLFLSRLRAFIYPP